MVEKNCIAWGNTVLPVPYCPLQITRVLSWGWTQASAMMGRRLNVLTLVLLLVRSRKCFSCRGCDYIIECEGRPSGMVSSASGVRLRKAPTPPPPSQYCVYCDEKPLISQTELQCSCRPVSMSAAVTQWNIPFSSARCTHCNTQHNLQWNKVTRNCWTDHKLGRSNSVARQAADRGAYIAGAFLYWKISFTCLASINLMFVVPYILVIKHIYYQDVRNHKYQIYWGQKAKEVFQYKNTKNWIQCTSSWTWIKHIRILPRCTEPQTSNSRGGYTSLE
jgi:hypothetical protein